MRTESQQAIQRNAKDFLKKELHAFHGAIADFGGTMNNTLKLVQLLHGNPQTAKEIADELCISIPTARAIILALVKGGVNIESTKPDGTVITYVMHDQIG